MVVPNVILNNGVAMPIIGLGTWNSAPGEVTQAVKDAIDAGYRHIDGAHCYQNEHEVGEGINAKIAEGVVKREDLFVVSKLWNSFHHPSMVRKGCETTLNDLKLSYVDLYLVHWPFAFVSGEGVFPVDSEGKIKFAHDDYVETWKEMEKLLADGLVKAIGISNFNKKQIERVLAVAKIVPAVNQIECHPYLTQKKLIAFCKSKGIEITAYSPLGSPNRPGASADEPKLLEDPKIIAIANKYKKTAAQILIRYQIDNGTVVIPKSVTKSRIISNFDVFDFKLTKEDLETIDSFNCNGRIIKWESMESNEYYPFLEEY